MWRTLVVCAVLNVAFAATSGLWGVLVTDFIQFGIAMTGSFAAAWFALRQPQVGGLDGLFRRIDIRTLAFLPDATDWAANAIAVFGVINIIYAAYVALAQKDIKKLVAYSSVSHMGFTLLGMAAMTPMAISGAAASPNMGYHSSPIVTFLMTLFNARLGWWLGNPGQTGQDSFRRESPKWALQPLFAEAFGWTDEHHPYVYVSDGGHFDNLGLYEMVRRRCQTIVVVDAGADPTCGFEDLSAAIRKIRSDMGIPITLTGGSIVARGASVPAGARAAMVGRIAYSAVDGGEPDTIDGQLVYLKPTIYNRKEPLDVVNYAQGHAAFPHESTSDQFFSESQFESYRALGLHTVELACASLGAPTDSATPHTLDEFVTSVGAYLR